MSCFECKNYDECSVIRSAQFLADTEASPDDLVELPHIINNLQKKANFMLHLIKTLEEKYKK